MVARSLTSPWLISTTRIQKRSCSQCASRNRHVFERVEPSNGSPTSKERQIRWLRSRRLLSSTNMLWKLKSSLRSPRADVGLDINENRPLTTRLTIASNRFLIANRGLAKAARYLRIPKSHAILPLRSSTTRASLHAIWASCPLITISSRFLREAIS